MWSKQCESAIHGHKIGSKHIFRHNTENKILKYHLWKFNYLKRCQEHEETIHGPTLRTRK